MSAIKGLYLDLIERILNGDTSVRECLIEFANDPHGLLRLSPVLRAVAIYLLLGFSVVPQRPGAKSPCVKWKRYQDEQPSVEECYEWWYRQWPDAGVAIVLGPVSQLFVIDVDGTEAHEELVRRLGGVPEAPKVNSGSGKKDRYHLLFQHPDVATKAKATPWHPQLEFRGHGGIVIAPPSYHKSGMPYKWANGKSLDDLVLPQVPAAILDALTDDARRRRAPVDHVVRTVNLPCLPNLSRATQDFLAGKYANGPDWNRKTFAAACDMAGNGYSQADAEPMLLAGAQPWNATEMETVSTTIRSAFSEPREPARTGRRRSRTIVVTETFEIKAE